MGKQMRFSGETGGSVCSCSCVSRRQAGQCSRAAWQAGRQADALFSRRENHAVGFGLFLGFVLYGAAWREKVGCMGEYHTSPPYGESGPWPLSESNQLLGQVL